MMKKAVRNGIIIIIIIFIASTSLFWDIIKIFKPEIISEPFQLLFSITYTILAISMTFDIDVFNEFWEKHIKLKAIFGKISHFATYSIEVIKYLSLWIPDILFNRNKAKTWNMIRDKIWRPAGRQ